MAVLVPMKNTMSNTFGTGDYSNEPYVINKEPSFGLKFGFLKKRKSGSVFSGESLCLHDITQHNKAAVIKLGKTIIDLNIDPKK